MDPAKVLEYVAAYDRRRASRLAIRDARAEQARDLAPALADICREYGARRVRLFGSLVTGRYGSTPDIDLAVDGLPAERFFDLLAALQIRAAPTGDRMEMERETVHKVAEAVVPVFDAMHERLEHLSGQIEEDLRPGHQNFTKRQLHPLMLC